jgi:hypothetical protein
MSTLKVNAITDASGGNTATINSMTPTADSLQGFRNRIINGGMVIDQRNAGAAVNGIASSIFITDRWAYFTNATAGAFNAGQNLNSVTPPAGFTKYLGFQVASTQTPSGSNAYFFGQKIEGFNVADLGWGASGAKSITISFWVRSSVTGTHSGNVQNTSNARSYIFSYTISSANTWEQKSITIAGDTTGTWPTDNTAGLIMYFNLGCGSSIATTAGSWNAAQYIGVTGGVSVVSNASATFYVTGVQLEVGSVATPFERRDYGRELAMCQRYYWKITGSTNVPFGSGFNSSTTQNEIVTFFPVEMRTAPTALEQSGTASHYRVRHANTDTTCSAVPTFQNASNWLAWSASIVASGLTAGQGSFLRSNNASAYLAWSAEL